MAPKDFIQANGASTFPYDIKDVEPETNSQLLSDFSGERTGFVQVGPKKYFFPIKYRSDAENIYNFEVRPDDVWIVTFPRSGTTWTQEMVWLIANDLDYKRAAETSLLMRFPFLEYSLFVHKDIKDELLAENEHDIEKTKIVEGMDAPMWVELTKSKERRFIKTHMPFSLLPPNLLTSGCKVVYVARNPKDVSISFFHLNRLMKTQGYSNDFQRHWEYFEKNLIDWSPYWEHFKEAWAIRNHKNLLFLFYEDMKMDICDAITKVSNFLGKSVNAEEMSKLQDHLDIKNFRNNASVNFDLLTNIGVSVKGEQAFIRQGKSGSWKEKFDNELNARADAWILKNIEGTDIKFPSIN